MTAPTDFLIAAYATGNNPDNWSVVSTLLSSVSADISSARVLEWEYQPYSSIVELADGEQFGRGSAQARWIFGALRPEQRENLKDFCTGLTAQVYIRTPTNETSAGVQVWRDALCWMHWNIGPELWGINAVQEIEIRFTQLEAA